MAHKDVSTDAEHRGGVVCSSVEAFVIKVKRRGYIVQLSTIKQPEYLESLLNSKHAWIIESFTKSATSSFLINIK